MSDRAMYVPSVECINPNFIVAYTYRKQGENLGTLGLRKDTNKWVVVDFMNYVEKYFDSERKAREFIKTSTPIYV